MPKFLSPIFALVLSTPFLVSEAQAQDPGPDPGSVTVGSFNYAGNACPAGSVAANVSPDARALTLLFDSWVVESDNTPSPIAQKQCRIDLRLVAPDGWRYAILGLDYRGYADLQAGARAEQTASYQFNGGAIGALKPLNLVGPLSSNYINSSSIDLAALPWSSCGGNMTLSINTSSKIDVSVPPIAKAVNLSSSQGRRAEQDLGAPILDMQLVHRDSAAQCKPGRGFGFNGTKAWVDAGCRGTFSALVSAPLPSPKPQGMLTVDSIDGQLTQSYGIAWQQCSPGSWVQANGINAKCSAVCNAAGMKAGRDPGGAACVSGEARPASAIGKINFAQGCWGSCTAMGNLPTTETPGGFCYAPGQKKDNDRTDKTTGCFCY